MSRTVYVVKKGLDYVKLVGRRGNYQIKTLPQNATQFEEREQAEFYASALRGQVETLTLGDRT